MKYKSEIYKAIHQDAVADFEVGAISEDRLHEFDKMCLVGETETSRTTEKFPETKYAAAVK